MRDAVAVEWRKLRRSRVPAVAALVAVVAMPLLGLAFVRLASAEGDGALAAKLGAMVVGTGWRGYLGTLGQLVAVGQFLATGFVVVWCFGREFADRTVGALFALPVGRATIAAAKLVVVLAWSVVTWITLAAVVAATGLAAGLDGAAGAVAADLLRLVALAGLSSMAALPLAVVATVGRGYLSGIGALIGVVAVSQVTVLFGVGGWFPFAAPGLWAASWTEPAFEVGGQQLALVGVTAAAGAAMTVTLWSRLQLA